MPTENLDERRGRYERMVAMRDAGKTYAEIGAAFPRNGRPLSRQRIDTILRNGPPKPVGRPRKEEES